MSAARGWLLLVAQAACSGAGSGFGPLPEGAGLASLAAELRSRDDTDHEGGPAGGAPR